MNENDGGAMLAAAQALYDLNLAKLLEKIRLNRRSVYRVMMDENGLIVSITPRRAGKPQNNCFTMLVSGSDDKLPSFGALTALRGFQVQIAQQLQKDIKRVLRANEAAYALQSGKSPVLDRTVKGKVEELERRFGLLPEPALKREHESQNARALRARLEEEEKEQILSEEVPDFALLLRQEIEYQERKQI